MVCKTLKQLNAQLNVMVMNPLYTGVKPNNSSNSLWH